MQQIDVQRTTLNFIILRPNAHSKLFFPSEYDSDLDKLRSIKYHSSSLRWSIIQEIQLNNWIFTLLHPPKLFLNGYGFSKMNNFLKFFSSLNLSSLNSHVCHVNSYYLICHSIYMDLIRYFIRILRDEASIL